MLALGTLKERANPFNLKCQPDSLFLPVLAQENTPMNFKGSFNR